MNQRVLTASEAYDDCLSFFEETLQPAMKVETGGFSGDLMPGNEFEISLTVTHGALTALVKRYSAAEFDFHSERNLIPSVSNQERINPLKDLYVELTIDFTPYGTVFGGSSNDNGGGMTEAEGGEDERPTANEITVDGPAPGPEAPSGPSFDAESTPSPATA
jgi:hypothetical protein